MVESCQVDLKKRDSILEEQTLISLKSLHNREQPPKKGLIKALFTIIVPK